MKLIVVSPEGPDPREHPSLAAMFAEGLLRYHVRKPHAPFAELEEWIRGVPPSFRSRLVLHQHHELVEALGLGGCHWKDRGRGRPPEPAMRDSVRGRWVGCSCHDLETLDSALGACDAVLFGPIFPSISKPGYRPASPGIGEEAGALLQTRDGDRRRTEVIAIGGVTGETLPLVRALGFDGAAVLGAVWQSQDPVGAFCRLKVISDSLAAHHGATVETDIADGAPASASFAAERAGPARSRSSFHSHPPSRGAALR